MSVSLAKQITQIVERKPTVFVIALNAKSTLARHQSVFTQAPYQSLPKTPVIYVLPQASYAQSGSTVMLPKGSQSLRVEPHLGVVFGKDATRVSRENAFSYLSGYMPVALYSLPNESYYRPDIEGRCREGFCVLGQEVSLNAVDHSQQYQIKVCVNEEMKKSSPQAEMQYDIAELVSVLSQFIAFKAGDILLTGSDDLPVQVQSNDEVTVEFVGLGSLSNQIC